MSLTRRLSRTKISAKLKNLQPAAEIAVLDTCCAIHNDEDIQKFLACNKPQTNPVILAPAAVIDELLAYQKGVLDEHSGFRAFRRLEEQGFVKRVDVEQLAREDEKLDYELAQVLPSVGRLASKAILHHQFQLDRRKSAELIVDIAMTVTPSKPLAGSLDDIRDTIDKTTQFVMRAFNAYNRSKHYGNADKWLSWAPYTMSRECAMKIAEFSHYFSQAHSSWFWGEVDAINSTHGVRVNAEKLSADESYLNRLEAAYEISVNSMLRRMVYEALLSRAHRAEICSIPRRKVRGRVLREYDCRFGNVTKADIHVASAYAWPYEIIDSELGEKIKEGMRLTLLSKDADIEQMIEIRKNYMWTHEECIN